MTFEVSENVCDYEGVLQRQLQDRLSTSVIFGEVQGGGGGEETVEDAIAGVVIRIKVSYATIMVDGHVGNMTGRTADLIEHRSAVVGGGGLQWQWADAEAENRWALELNPNDAAAHLGLANWLTCQGRTEEALAWSRRARELDPLGITIGWNLFYARRYDEAIHELRSVLAVRPGDVEALWVLGFVLIANNQPE